jgi:hypothetical protein
MKTIIWKELRENAKWAALALVAAIIATIWVLTVCSFHRSYAPRLFSIQLPLVIVLVSSVCSLLLGFTYSFPNLWRDRWAFLIQRGVSMHKIFFAKTIAPPFSTSSLLAPCWRSRCFGWPAVEFSDFHLNGDAVTFARL